MQLQAPSPLENLISWDVIADRMSSKEGMAELITMNSTDAKFTVDMLADVSKYYYSSRIVLTWVLLSVYNRNS